MVAGWSPACLTRWMASRAMAYPSRTRGGVSRAELVKLFVAGAALVPLYLVFADRAAIAGWRYGEALLVMGWFTPADLPPISELNRQRIEQALTTSVDAWFSAPAGHRP